MTEPPTWIDMRPMPLPTMPRQVRIARWWLFAMAAIAFAVGVFVFVNAEGESHAYRAGRLMGDMLAALVGALLALRFARGTGRTRVAAIVCAALTLLSAVRMATEGESVGLVQIAGAIVVATQLTRTPAKEWFDRPAPRRE
ncbi:hypothetical protein [Embleya sp. NPDC005971]|uniref:hypothetical protein n=1 Tax=Embleya sp. NPDC005971 TaxID=3156724 RepID=UPI0033CF82AA